MTGTSYVSEWVTLRDENNNFEPQYTHKVRYLWNIILGPGFLSKFLMITTSLLYMFMHESPPPHPPLAFLH